MLKQCTAIVPALTCQFAAVLAACLTLTYSKPAASREPSFEPFFASRMWEVAFGPKTPQPVTSEFVNLLHELNAGLILNEPGAPALDRPYLNPSLTAGEQTGWRLMPFMLLQLCSLPNDGQWSPIETDMANALLSIIARMETQLSDSQATSDPENNTLAQTQACQQFVQRSSDPQYLGHMIFTSDDGPWALDGLTEECLPKEEKAITEQFILRTCQQPSGDWGIEGVKNGELLWQQSLSQVPTNSSLAFLDMPSIDLGEYSWRINLSFGELTHLYLDQDLAPMFYFTSW